MKNIRYNYEECCLSDVYRDSYTGASELMMKEYDDDVSDVYQQHSCHRRSSVAEVNNSSIIISHLDIRHGNTCAELEFPSPISSMSDMQKCIYCSFKKGHLLYSNSLRETFFECFKTQRAVIIPYFTRYSSNVKNPLVSLGR
ncbi:hypothetical protein T01_2372 [Trichinella spiralis]|uniref:Uncharacterized protein n=1 Tax=Trichinella spiralis TaxID=6334 RepID=A0A0V1BD65_TRISP|nr:hypothetical protein T01_2372 [Trichinella spiralis]